MANVLKPKRTSTAGKVPTTTDIANAGEIALNMADAKLYFRDGNSTIKELTVTTAQGVPFSGVTSKPTTLSGYGITDAASLSSTLPSNIGTASIGVATTAARADHVHDLAASGVTAATYGSSTNIPQIAVDAKGRITSASNVAVSIPSGSISVTGGDITMSGSTGTAITNATLANSGVTAGTYTKITVDAKGRATSGTTLSASDIPALDASKITTGTISSSVLPSYVDDVVEGTNLAAFPTTGETGKIYVALDTNKAYRWSGSTYVYITSGAVDSVAGKTGVVTLVKSDVGLGNVDNTSDANKPISTATQTALNSKANSATTLSGYGITDAYTKTQVDTLAGNYYTKTQVDTLASNYYTKTNLDGGQLDNRYYTQTQINTLSSNYVPKTTTVNGHALSGNVSVGIAELSGTSISSPSSGQVLSYNGTNWVNSSNNVPASISGLTSYHLLSGSLALASTTPTSGFSTTLYTGNGSTQSINTGVDMATQWGSDASETYGGLVWLKDRTAAEYNGLYDTTRGTINWLSSNATAANTVVANSLTSFNNNGFTHGSYAGSNASGHNIASWNFQTSHRTSGTTNHGKAYTCHYNPYTGFTMVKYEGSGLAGHEIPHMLGRKLGFSTQKKLTAIGTWRVFVDTITSTSTSLRLDGTDALYTDSTLGYLSNDNSLILSTHTDYNASSNIYIMYGWANSYFDTNNTLIGNYEIGVYQGTGAAGNKVTTRGKPAWVMIKRLDSTSNWAISDNKRSQTYLLYPNTSGADDSDYSSHIQFNSDGITVGSASIVNASGGQYLYMVVYDNDSGSGKSKYPKPLDNPVINLTATVPLACGVDTNGTKISVVSKNETVTGVTLSLGKNYIAWVGE